VADGDRPLTLASDFPAASFDDWLARAGDLDRLRRSPTYDGITIEPLYTSADETADAGLPGFVPFVRGRTAASTRMGWDIRVIVDGAIAGRGREELELGANSLWLELRHLADRDDSTLAGLLTSTLDGVFLEAAPVVLAAGRRWPAAAAALAARWESSGLVPAPGGSLGADPFGAWTSDRSIDLPGELVAVAEWAARLAVDAPGVRVVTVDGSRYHNAGASDAQELGFTIGAAVETLRSLPGDPFGAVELRLATTIDQFATIAKFRAARRLWSRVAEVVGEPEAAARTPLHAVTSTAMMSRYDSAVNLLRSTIACFAAGVAGADAITVLAHDSMSATVPSELGRRLARNTQSVLSMEANVARAIDPAGGSWYIERLSEQLAERAWEVFQEIEVAGGFRAAVEAGVLDERMSATAARRAGDVAHRRKKIVGVTDYPDLTERLPDDDPGVDGSDRVRRWAEPFESLRWRVDRAAASGRAPTVFLATLGGPTSRMTRFGAAADFFGIAGIDTVRGPVTDDLGEVTAAFSASGTSVACICPALDDLVEPDGLREALTAAGVTRVYSALALGGDAVMMLGDLLEHLGVP
jgi:methylmalonyl-CoA mutase